MGSTDKPEKAPGGKGKLLLGVWEIALVLGIIGCMAAIATPKFGGARTRANTRACYANQKTLVGAIEMYNLDSYSNDNKPLRPLVKTDADLASVKHTLITSGYLQSIPDDPGEGRGTFEHYKLTSGGNGITCTVHGSIQ